MATGYRNSAGSDFDTLFDPYIAGTKPGATGYRTIDGVDLNQRYAPIALGSKGPNVGYRISSGVDVSNLWAAYGTSQQTLPFNGQSYTCGYNIPNASSGYSLIGFRIVSGTTWQVYKMPNGAAATILASGSLPTGAATVQFTWGSYTVGTGQTDAGGVTSNGATSAVAVSSNPDAHYQTATNTSTSGSKSRNYAFTVDFFASGGGNISHNICNLIGDTEGSV